MSDSQPDFNWVLERSKCSLSYEFSLLQKEAGENASFRNSQFGAGHRFGVECRSASKHEFIVRRWDSHNIDDDAIATFSLHPDGIHVADEFHNRVFTLTVTLNDTGECRFQIDGIGEFKRWQILKRALERIFFFTFNAQ